MEKKPIILRVVFLLNALLMFLPFIFYYIFTSKNIQVDGLEPIHMIYTGIGYILSFALMVTSILRRNLIAFRSVFVLVILISLPTKAYIGIVFAIVSLLLSLHKKIRLYLTHKPQMI